MGNIIKDNFNMGCLCLRRQKEGAKEASKEPEIKEENNSSSRMFLSHDAGYNTIDQSSKRIPNLNSLPQKRERLTDSPRVEIESNPRKSVPGFSNSYTPSNGSKPRNSVPAKMKSATSSDNQTSHKSSPTHIRESSSNLDLKPKSPRRSAKRQQELLQSSQTSSQRPIEQSDSLSSTDSNPFAYSIVNLSQSSVEPRLSQNSYPISNPPSHHSSQAKSSQSESESPQPEPLRPKPKSPAPKSPKPGPLRPKSPLNPILPPESSEKQDLEDKNKYETIINTRINTISKRLPINSLKAVYFFNKEFKQRVDKIKPLYQSWARVRGDGNCYYRAIGVAFMELCCRETTSPELIVRYANALKLVADYSVSGTTSEIYSYHFSELNSLCMMKQDNKPDIMIYLHILLQEPEFDRGMVSEMRKLAAYVLDINRKNPDFTAFMIDSFGSHMNAILTWGQEAEGIEFKCMSEALGVHIQHVSVYDSDSINTFSPSISTEDKLHILYKTGHYDLLYPAEHNLLDGYDTNSGEFIVKEY
jgi:ubiquitin thioesterase protein OTUB1